MQTTVKTDPERVEGADWWALALIVLCYGLLICTEG